jgi:Flp pilus assembly protein TadD
MKNMKNNMAVCLLILGIFFLVSGCGSSKGFRLEIESGAGKNPKNIPEQASSPSDAHQKVKDLPEMSSDEYEQLGDALLSKKNYYLAFVQYEKSLQINPGNNRVEYKKGLTLLLGGKSDEAIDQLKLVLKQDPKFAHAYEGIGRAYFQKKEYEQAENFFLQAVVLEPRLWKSNTFLGYIHDSRKDYNSAIREYKTAIKVRPDEGTLYNNLGVSYTMAGEYRNAVEAFNKAVNLNYRDSKVFNNMAVALASLGRYDETLDAFVKGGGEAQAYNNLGCIYLHKEKYREAVKCFEKAIELEPSFYAKAFDNLKKARKGSITQ